MQNVAIRAARPEMIRGAIASLVALAGILIADFWGQIKDQKIGVVVDPALGRERTFAFVGAIIVLLAGVMAVREFASAIRKGSEAREAGARGAALAFIASLVGYLIVVLATLGVLSVDLGGLLVGGAVTGVVVGIAAQQTIGNFFAGIVLLVARPFNIGEYVVLRSGPLGGEYEGTVTDMSLFYVHLMTASGPVSLPNAGVLASAIGPGARSDKKDEEEELPDEG